MKRSFMGFEDNCNVTESQRSKRTFIRSLFPGDGPYCKNSEDTINLGSCFCLFLVVSQILVWFVGTYSIYILDIDDINIKIVWMFDSIFMLFYAYFLWSMCDICRGIEGYIILFFLNIIYSMLRYIFLNDLLIDSKEDKLIDDFVNSKPTL